METILIVLGVAYIGIGLIIMARRNAHSSGAVNGPSSGYEVFVVAALWPLYILSHAKKKRSNLEE